MMERTPLHEQHRLAGAKLIDFAGWDMPIQYSGVIDEYQTVRNRVGLFDVSHMGRLGISGTGAGAFLQRMTTNDVMKLAVGQAQYSMVCNGHGGIKDDIFVYRTGLHDYLLCVNASNRIKILDWLRQHPGNDEGWTIEDRTAAVAQIAIQGPLSTTVLGSLMEDDLGTLKLHHFRESRVASLGCLVARTGYTGEPGYEINVPSDEAPVLWNRLLERGRAQGIKPAGLGARDLLRLDMGYLLYGNDIDEETTPLEAGAEWTISWNKGDFVGSQALLRQRQTGPTRHLVGLELLEKAVPRHGCKIVSKRTSEPIGEVTSGNLSPLLQKGIGLGYVPFDYKEAGTEILIDIRGKLVPARIVKPPFYRKPKR
ncbi:MAG TPA: glycine cleavage system aminomethyltransferase GcvT [Nitrospira sp.]|nr:glycine cleavage system aminomethyltransferase GcvT [Nitrospira sp.]